MKRQEFLKISSTFLLSLPFLSCEGDDKFVLGDSSISIDEASKWFNNLKKSARSDSIAIERECVWRYAEKITTSKSQEMIIAPINYQNNKYLGALSYNEADDEAKKKIDLDNTFLVEEKMLFIKNRKGVIENYHVRYIPNNDYNKKNKRLNRKEDFEGLILLYNSNEEFVEGSIVKNGKLTGKVSITVKNARRECNYYTVVTSTTVYVSSCGINCTSVTVVATTGTQVFCYDYDAGGGWMGNDLDPRDTYIRNTGYVNLVDCQVDTSLSDWEDIDLPCTFSYGGDSGLTKSELYMSILIDETQNQLGITDIIGALSALTGANIIETRTKFAGATPNTSIASKYLSRMIPGNSPISLPTLTGWPGVNLKLSWTKSFGRFAGRTVPVVGWGLLAYDLIAILYKTTSKFNDITQNC